MIAFEPVDAANLRHADADYELFFSDPDSRFKKNGLLQKMQLFAPQPNGESVYFYCGSASTTARLFGRQFCTNSVGRPMVPSAGSDFRRYVQADYLKVADSGALSASRVSINLDVSANDTRKVDFWRLAFPFETGMGTAVGVLTRFCADRCDTA